MVGESKGRRRLKRAPVPVMLAQTEGPRIARSAQSVVARGLPEVEVTADAAYRAGEHALTDDREGRLQRGMQVAEEDLRGRATQEAVRGQEGTVAGRWRDSAREPAADGTGARRMAPARPGSMSARAVSGRQPVRLELNATGPGGGRGLRTAEFEMKAAMAVGTVREVLGPIVRRRPATPGAGEREGKRGQSRLGETHETGHGLARDRRREWRRAKERAAAMVAAAEERLRLDMARW